MAEGITFAFDWEVSLMVWLQQALGSAGAAIMSVITLFGEEMIMVAVLGYLYWCFDKEFGKFIGINLVTGLVLNPMLKNIALRRRPYMDWAQIKCLKPVHADADIMDIAAQGYSFPSGHSMNAAIVYGSFPRYKKGVMWLRVIGIALPALVGISRFCLGVHYPTDVLVGWACGAVVVFLVPVLARKVKRGVLCTVIFVVSLAGIFYCRTSDYYTSLGIMAGFFLSLPFEERFVKFENTTVWWKVIVRLMGGVAVYFGVNTLLKLPFSDAFLDSATMAAFLVRAVRYTVVTFAAIGVYPMVFRLIDGKAGKA